MKKEGEKDLEEEVYEVPRLSIKPYRRKLGMAIAQIHERYEDLGLKVASDRGSVDRKTELGYFLEDIENTLVIFQVIDQLELLKELGPDALAISTLTPEKGAIIILQEILFHMDPSVLLIVLQEQLDQFLFLSEGSSPSEAYDKARKLISSEDKARIKEALESQLLHLEELLAEKEKLALKKESKRTRKPKKPKISEIKSLEQLKNLFTSGAIRRVNWSNLPLELHKALVIELGRQTKTKKKLSELNSIDYRETKLAVLNQRTLFGFYTHWYKKNKTYKPTVRFILEKLGLVEETLSIKELKTLEQLKNLLTSGAITGIPWRALPLELHKALVIELGRQTKTKKKLSELNLIDYRETKLAVLNQRTLIGLYAYWYRENKTDSVITRFILEKLGLIERIPDIKEVSTKEPRPTKLKISEITTLEQLKNLLISGAIRRVNWPNLPLEVHKALVQELAREAEKEPFELTNQDFETRKLSILNQKTLRGFLAHWRKKNKTDKPVTSFILKELGLKGRREERYERLEELIKKHQARISEIAKDLNVSDPTISRWINEDSGLKKLTEDQRRVRAEESKKRKPRIRKPKRSKMSEIKTLDELKALLTSGERKRITWRDLPLELHKALVQELAREAEEELLELTQVDYREFRLGVLNRQTLGGFYGYWTDISIAGKSTCRFILEELGLVTTRIKSFEEIKTIDELKKLFDLGAIKRVFWSQLSKQVQAMLVEELAVLREKPVEKLIKRDYTEVTFPVLGGNTLGGMYLHYSKQNKTRRRTPHFILEELGLIKEETK